MKKLLALISFSILFFNCNKTNSGQTYCWELVSVSGERLQQVCNLTEDQLIHCSYVGFYPDSTGVYVHPCQYYKVIPNEPVNCWILNGSLYKNITQSYVDLLKKCYGISTAVITNCNSTICNDWYNKNVNVSKTTGDSTVYQPSYRQYCGDTLNTLFPGRKVKMFETKDSTYYKVFILN